MVQNEGAAAVDRAGNDASEVCVSDPLPPISDSSVHAESDAQTRFVQQHLRRIFLLIYRIVGNVEDAQDLTQETFIKALQRQTQLKDLDRAAHWLSRIASNTAIDFLRRHRRITHTDLNEISERAGNFENPEEWVLRGAKTVVDTVDDLRVPRGTEGSPSCPGWERNGREPAQGHRTIQGPRNPTDSHWRCAALRQHGHATGCRDTISFEISRWRAASEGFRKR